MKIIIRNVGIVIVLCLVFFFVLPMLNPEGKQEEKKENLELYDQKAENVIEDFNHIALMGITMPFPVKISELPAEFHIADMYYDEMTDGIDAGDYFHCHLLNEENEEIAYIRVTNLKQNQAISPDQMTITYIRLRHSNMTIKSMQSLLKYMEGLVLEQIIRRLKRYFQTLRFLRKKSMEL